MNQRVKVRLNKAAVRDQLLRSPEMGQICAEYAADIARKCGAGYTFDSFTGKNRTNASVYAETAEAIRDNLKNNTILKVVGGQ